MQLIELWDKEGIVDIHLLSSTILKGTSGLNHCHNSLKILGRHQSTEDFTTKITKLWEWETKHIHHQGLKMLSTLPTMQSPAKQVAKKVEVGT